MKILYSVTISSNDDDSVIFRYKVAAGSIQSAARKGIHAYRKEDDRLVGRPRVTRVEELGVLA